MTLRSITGDMRSVGKWGKAARRLYGGLVVSPFRPGDMVKADFDLYEFPTDHIGRKSYVTVRGHSRSVPAPYTYKGCDGLNYVHPDFGGTWDGLSGGEQSAYVMPDMKGYVSPLEPGVVVHSRPQHRDHMRRHGVVEVGTEKLGNFSRSVGEMSKMNRAGHDIARALQGNR